MKRVYRILVLVLILALTLACTSIVGGERPPANAVVIEVVGNTSLTAWLTAAARDFNAARIKLSDDRPAYVTLQSVEAGQEIVDIASGSAAPDLWIPDTPVWVDVLAEKGKSDFQGDCGSVAQSPLVIAVWQPIAEALGWPGRSLGWLDFGSLAADTSAWLYYSGGQFGDTFRLGHTHPGLSSTGADTLLAVVQAASLKQEAVSEADIQQPITQASVIAFESSVTLFSSATDSLGSTMRQRGVGYLGAAIVYESTVVQYGQGDLNFVPIYPFEGTFLATFPACVNSTSGAEQQEAARLFRDYLTGVDGQRQAIASGLRPVNPAVPAAAPLDEAHGVDLSQPEVIFDSPSPGTLFAVQELWMTARKDLNLVMVLDTSGSMEGTKIENVRMAAIQFVEQMGEDDYLSLIVFNNETNLRFEHVQVGPNRQFITDEIRQLSAGGSTPLYDAIADSAAIIAGTSSSQTTNAMVVLTDGLDTSSSHHQFNHELISIAVANDTTIFTIAYGSDADEDLLAQLASQANGSFFLGTDASIAAIYAEMSTAFGGNLGIGR